jgi:hypothetical protein
MRPVRLPEVRKAPCEVHVLHPHSHAFAAPGSNVCSGRFWCVRCKRWTDGEKCKPGKAKAA